MPLVAAGIRARRAETEIKGFRRGQAPVNIIQKMYGLGILSRTTLELATKELNSYLQENTLELIDSPLMVENTLSRVEHVDIEHPGKIEIKFMYGLKPKIALSSLHQIEIDDFEIKDVSDDSIADAIKRLQIQYGTTQEGMQAEPGDSVYVSLTSATGSVQTTYLPAGGMKIGKQDVSLVGLKPHDKLTLNFSPAHYCSLPHVPTYYQESSQLLNQLTGAYEVTVEKIYRPVLAELNQDFLLQIFPQQEVTTIDELREEVRLTLIRHAQIDAESLLTGNIKQALFKHLSFDLPANFLKKRIQSQFPDWSEELVETYYRVYRENSLRWSLICEKVIQEFDIHISTADIAQQLQLTYPSSNISLEQLSKKIEQSFTTGKLDKSYLDAYHWVTESQVLDVLKDKVTLRIQKKTVEEFNAHVAHMFSHRHEHDHHCPEC